MKEVLHRKYTQILFKKFNNTPCKKVLKRTKAHINVNKTGFWVLTHQLSSTLISYKLVIAVRLIFHSNLCKIIM